MTFKEWLFTDDERLAFYLIHMEEEEDWDENNEGEMEVIGHTLFYVTVDGMSFGSETEALEHQMELLKESVIVGDEVWEAKW